jgi:hypothetical protein
VSTCCLSNASTSSDVPRVSLGAQARNLQSIASSGTTINSITDPNGDEWTLTRNGSET